MSVQRVSENTYADGREVRVDTRRVSGVLAVLVAAFLLLTSCSVRSRYPSVELGYGISLAFPFIQAVSAFGDTTAAPWHREQPGVWTSQLLVDGDSLNATMVVRRRSEDQTYELLFQLKNKGTRLARFEQISLIRLTEEKGGFLDFSTGEPPRFRFEGGDSAVALQLAPDSSFTCAAETLLVVQPITRLNWRLAFIDTHGGQPSIRLRRQIRLKRRYDLTLQLRYSPPLQVQPGQRVSIARLESQARLGTAAQRIRQ